MQELINEIVELTREAGPEPTETGVPGLLMIKGDVPTSQLSAVYKPMIGLVVSGKKTLTIGSRVLTMTGPSYFLVPMHLPARGSVSSGADVGDYLSLGLSLNFESVQTLLRDLPLDIISSRASAFDSCEADADFVKPWLRLMRLRTNPHDIPALAPAYEREILYRVLIGPQGWYLRQLAARESAFSKIVGSVQWLRTNFTEPVVVKKLAREAGMGITTFHRQFKRATGMSPIQFQKQLRLLEARNLLAFEGHAVATASYEVGYQSPSQFNREYTRFFGASPGRDRLALQAS
jgi:AraC-like DNA-binding protein